MNKTNNKKGNLTLLSLMWVSKFKLDNLYFSLGKNKMKHIKQIKQRDVFSMKLLNYVVFSLLVVGGFFLKYIILMKFSDFFFLLFN